MKTYQIIKKTILATSCFVYLELQATLTIPKLVSDFIEQAQNVIQYYTSKNPIIIKDVLKDLKDKLNEFNLTTNIIDSCRPYIKNSLIDKRPIIEIHDVVNELFNAQDEETKCELYLRLTICLFAEKHKDLELAELAKFPLYSET